MTKPGANEPTVIELAESVRRGERKAVEVVDEYLGRIAEGNERLNAFVHLDADLAHAAASAVDEAVARGDDPGPLAGVPFGVKDLEHCEGMPTTFGSVPVHRPRTRAEGQPQRRAAACRGCGSGRQDRQPRSSARSTSPRRRSSASPAIRGTSRARPVARAAARRPRWPPASFRSRPRRTAAARSASRRRSPGSSVTRRATAASRTRSRPPTRRA